MPKNKIEDLRNHLFEQLERLQDDEKMKNPISLERELKRAAAISEVAQVIVNTAKVETDYLRVTGKTKRHSPPVFIDIEHTGPIHVACYFIDPLISCFFNLGRLKERTAMKMKK